MILAILALALPAQAAPHGPLAGARPTPTGNLRPCLLVVAAPGSKTANDAVNEFWHTVNTEIAGKLVERLAADGSTVALERIPREKQGSDIVEAIALALDRERCDRLLDLRHRLGGGSGPEGFFAFHAKALGVTTTETGFTLGPDLFEKTYRFPLTDEMLKSLSMDQVAADMARDLGEAGVLSREGEAAASGSDPAAPLDEATFVRLLQGSPAFTGENAGRVFVRVVAFERLSDQRGDAWIGEVEWEDGDAVRSGIVPALRESDVRGEVLHTAEGWALYALVPDMDIETAVKGLKQNAARAREAATLGDVRVLISAQMAYSSVTGSVYGEVTCLEQPEECIEGYSGPVFLVEGFVADGEQAGYLRTFHPGPAAPGGGLATWAFTAVPTEPGVTGFRGFCGDATGRICATADGSAPPVEGGACADPCAAIE